MPGFVNTPAKEVRWEKAKSAASKSTSKGSDSYWRLSNFIFHKMGKSEDDQQAAEFYKSTLTKDELSKSEELLKSLFVSASTGLAASETSKGTTIPSGTKMPKAKSMPKAIDKPSRFFKSEIEEFEHVKHPTLCKLRDLLKNNRLKNKK